MRNQKLKMYSVISGQSEDGLHEVSRAYPVAVSPFLMKRFEEGSYSLSAMRQFMPDIRELDNVEGYISDPTGEQNLHPERSVLQTYENRLALVLTNKCLVYCRFCFRKSFVGQPGDKRIEQEDLAKALEYLRRHHDIEDILLSGGDPLALPNKKLIPFMQKILELPNIKTIRIHSRALSVSPDRIDDSLVEFLRTDDRFWYYAHMNHPDDVNHPAVISAVRKLQSARVPIMNQSVILAGVNDNPEVMKQLMKRCYENKIIPYNLYILDRVKGVAYFDVPHQTIIEIYKAISSLPGPAQPVLVFVDENSRKHRTVWDDQIGLETFLMSRKQVIEAS